MAIDTHGVKGKPWVGFDLDGTLATYDHWRGIQHIGEPVKPMCDLIKKLRDEGKAVKILTARVAPKDGDTKEAAIARAFIAKWCKDNLGFVPPITHEKDSLMETLYDDRVKAVEQNTGKVLNMAKFNVGDKVKWSFGGGPMVVVEVDGANYLCRDNKGQEVVYSEDKLVAANSRACNSTNAIVRKAMNSTALNFSPGDKVSIVDTDIRYGGDKGEVVRKDGFRYVVRLTSRLDKPEVLLQPNQLKAANAEDAQGHEHGSDGKFASKGGGSDGGDSYEDPKTKRMKERLAKMREKNEALRKEIDQRKAALAGKKEETEKMRADVMKANVEKWKAGLPKTTNSVVAKALNAVAKNADEYVIRKAFTPGKWFLERKAKSLGDAGSVKIFSSEDEARSYAKSKGLSVVNAVARNDKWIDDFHVIVTGGTPDKELVDALKKKAAAWKAAKRNFSDAAARAAHDKAESDAMAVAKRLGARWVQQGAVLKVIMPNSVAKNAEDDWVERFEVGGVYHGPYMNKDWLAKVLFRTDSSIRVAIKSRRDKTWHGKDEQVTLRINKRQAEEDGTEVAKGYGWEFWANDFE